MVIKWMPPSFDPKPPEPVVIPRLETEIIAAIEPPLQLPTAEELEAIRTAAFQEGYTQGFQTGNQQGEVEGLQTGKAAGAQAGYKQAYDDAKADIDSLITMMTNGIAAMKAIVWE